MRIAISILLFASSALASGYDVKVLPSLGGSVSAAAGLTDSGVATGYSTLAGDAVMHATVWRFGSATDLGTLGGANSGVFWPVKNDSGLVAGISQTSTPDPLGESWSCSAFLPPSDTTCLGFVWRQGVMRALPTLGGNNAFVAGANDRGQITGWAENQVRDPTCTNGQVLQFRPVIWEEESIRELPLLHGDSSGAATGINDRGQAIGISGTCDQAVGRFTAAHAVLWDRDGVTDLGNLGGVAWNTPMAINHRGDVAGFANVPGGANPGSLNEHAFLWTAGSGMIDLGTLPGDVHSQALGINQRRQVVGTSCTAHFASCRAFLWDNGVLIDLSASVTGTGLSAALAAQDINDRGVIAGQGTDASGALVAFIATPRSDP